MINSMMNLNQEFNPELFDYSTGYDTEPDIQVNHNLSSWIISEGIRFYNLFKTPPSGLCGLAAVS